MVVGAAAAALAGAGGGIAMPLAAATDVLPIDWSLVPVTTASTPTSLQGTPTGCTCLDSGASPCETFNCECVCDLTAGACDANCCCDSECTAAEKARFAAANTCLEEGPADEGLRMCVNLKTDLIATVNAKDRLKLEEKRSGLDNLLCVVEDNNPAKGLFFATPTLTSTTVVEAGYSYKQPVRLLPEHTGAAYAVKGGLVAGMQVGASTIERPGPGLMSVPAAGLGGVCTPHAYAAFGADIAARSCAVPFASMAAVCPSLSAESLVTNLRVAPSPGAATDTWLTPTLSSVTLYDAATGTSTVESAANAQLAGNAAARTPTASDCKWAVRRVDYTVRHSGAGEVSAVEAAVTLQHYNFAGAGSVQQTFSLTYRSTEAVTASAAAGNQVARMRSGNPGYIPGRPVLSGYATALTTADGAKAAVAASERGLLLRGPAADGSCDGGAHASVSVGFGEALSFGCARSLTKAQLQAACSAAAIPDFLGANDTVVGAFGNADPYKTWEWINLQLSALTPTPTWDAVSGSCQGLVTSYHIEFVWGDVGEKSNPQPRIVSAKASWGVDTWQFTAAAGAAQAFTARTTVDFVKVTADDVTEFVPPAPPLLPELPNDLFFPFDIAADNTATTSAAAGRVGGGGGAAAGAALVAAVAVLLAWNARA